MTTDPDQAVTYDVRSEVAVLTIDFPPVNAAGYPVREGLMRGLDKALADPAVVAVVLVGAHDKFIAGADIREFGKPKIPPMLRDLIERMVGASKPVVAAIDGHALGGGLEVALGAHYRVAASRAKVGLPEVNLGLLPGGGGTQRGTRLMGPVAALELILSGEHVSAAKGLALGIVDAVTDDDVTTAAIAFARQKAADGGPWPIAVQRTDKVAGVDPGLFEKVRTENSGKWKGMVAPFEIVNAIEAACTMAPQDGLVFEREAFGRCEEAPSRAAQVHLFFAERAAAKIDNMPGDVKPKPIRSVGIVGAGTMGGGIAMSVANAGMSVKLLDASAEGLAAGMARVTANYQNSVARGSLSQDKVDAALARIEAVTDMAALAEVDLVIEAVFETMAIKREVFGKLDAVCKPGAVLASNTSALDIDEIAGATKRPGDVIGLHFFSPANVMKLVEVVRGDHASPETIVTAMAFAKAIGKVGVLAGNCEGFIGNRILASYSGEANQLLLEGATPWQIDNALKAFGLPMGVYLMLDMAGLDVGMRMREDGIKRGLIDPNDPSHNPLMDRLCELGRFGQKTAAGVYAYEGRTPSPDPLVEHMLRQISVEKGIERRSFTDEEIVSRVMLAAVNEGAKILEEGIAQRSSDIDVIYVFGYGFPKYRGGPMFWAEQQGLAAVHEQMKAYEAQLGPRWTPAKLIAQRAEAGAGWKG